MSPFPHPAVCGERQVADVIKTGPDGRTLRAPWMGGDFRA